MDGASMEVVELYRVQEDWGAESVLNVLPVALGLCFATLTPFALQPVFQEGLSGLVWTPPAWGSFLFRRHALLCSSSQRVWILRVGM